MKAREDEQPLVSGPEGNEFAEENRREFLKKCGRFAAYTTPAVVALLSHNEKDAHATVASATT